MSAIARDLVGKTIVVGITGGIAAYKSAEVVRRLQDHGAVVQVVMTDAATHFITAVTMQALSGRPVFTNQWDARVDNNMAHIELSRSADAIVIVPATADFMAKIAVGIADDLLTTMCLARDIPLVIVPAMNRQMWAHPATQRNAAQLHADGVSIFGPAAGDQACGEVGEGRMLEPDEIIADLVAMFQPKILAGLHVVITAGPTYEPIDPVRSITNQSSGLMGYALAQAAREAGARVTLVSGPTALSTPRSVERIDVSTALQMMAAVSAVIGQADVFISVAAVADWRIKNPSPIKLKKDDEKGPPSLEFERNPDILATVAALPNAPFCVGFAAETSDLDDHAQAKRTKKNVALIVGNLAQHAIGATHSELVLYDEHGRTLLEDADKLTQARRLIVDIARRLADI